MVEGRPVHLGHSYRRRRVADRGWELVQGAAGLEASSPVDLIQTQIVYVFYYLTNSLTANKCHHKAVIHRTVQWNLEVTNTYRIAIRWSQL